MGCSESGATYLTLYRGERTDVRTFVPNSSASLESAAATSGSLMSLQPFSPQIRTQNSSFAATVGAASAASVTSRTSATSLRLTPDVRSGRAARSLAARSAESSRAVAPFLEACRVHPPARAYLERKQNDCPWSAIRLIGGAHPLLRWGVYRACTWLAITPPPTVRELVEGGVFQWQLEP